MTEPVYRGRRFAVHDVPVPGTGVRREVIIHPGSVVVLPLLPDGRVVLIRNYRVSVGERLLELVAGTLEPPEPPLECAARELREEAGYEAGSIEPLGWFYPLPGISSERMYAFVARGLTAVGQSLEPGEQITVEIQPLDALRAAIARGEVHDGKTITTLALFDSAGRRRAGRR